MSNSGKMVVNFYLRWTRCNRHQSLPGRLPDRWGTVLLEPPCQYSTCNDLSVTFLCSSLAHPLVCAAGTQRIVQPSQRRLLLQPDLSGAQREAP